MSAEASSYSVHMLPPAYPDRLHPWTCRHHPRFKVSAVAQIVTYEGGRNGIEYDHMVCLGCGAPLKESFGGNILVDLTEVMRKQAMHLPMFRRAWHLRERWTRLALKLFGPDGWNGRHERVARFIDPHLTMRMEVVGDGLGRCWFDGGYLRPEESAAAPTPRPKRARRAEAARAGEVSP